MVLILLVALLAAVAGPVYLAMAFKDSHPILANICLALVLAEIGALLVGVTVHERAKAKLRQQRSLLLPRPPNAGGLEVAGLALLLSAAVVGFGVALACPLSRAAIWATGVLAAGTLAALVYRVWPRRADRRPPEVRPDVVQAYREFARTWVAPHESHIPVPRPPGFPEGIQSRSAQGGTVLPALVADLAELSDEDSTWYLATVYYELDGRPQLASIHVSEEAFAMLSASVANAPLQGQYFPVLVAPETPGSAQFYACPRDRAAAS